MGKNSQHLNKSSSRKRKRCLARQLDSFLSKNGLVKPLNRVCLEQKRQKKATGKGLLLQFLFAMVFWVTSAYAMKANPVPKTVLQKFDVQKFLSKSTFYREICNLDFGSLEKFCDKLVQKTIKAKDKVIVTLDAHAIKVWSKKYANAVWGKSSCGSFFGYKLFAAILHGTDVVIDHLLAPANYVEHHFAVWQVEQVLSKLGKIDVLLMDRGYFSFIFFAYLIEKGIGFVTVAEDGTAAIQPYLRDISRCVFHKLKEGCWYHETLLWFPKLKKNLRVVFVRKEVKGKLYEYELITNLPAKDYSTVEVIKLYPKRQGREDVFDRLENELKLHKPSKIVDFKGVEAFVALTIASYNVYTAFSNNLVGAYFTVQKMYRWFLFGEIEEVIASRKEEEIVEEAVSEAERYKLDSRQTLFNSGKSTVNPIYNPVFQPKPKPQLPQKTKNRLKNIYQPKQYKIPAKVYSLMGKERLVFG